MEIKCQLKNKIICNSAKTCILMTKKSSLKMQELYLFLQNKTKKFNFGYDLSWPYFCSSRFQKSGSKNFSQFEFPDIFHCKSAKKSKVLYSHPDLMGKMWAPNKVPYYKNNRRNLIIIRLSHILQRNAVQW